MQKSVLITGICGFIGYHVARMLRDEYDIIGIDNMNDYHNISLKRQRLSLLKDHITFIEGDICDTEFLNNLFFLYHPDIVIHLAAQAGVAPSFKEPLRYIQSNIMGFQNMIDVSIRYEVEHFLFASSSSVYGSNPDVPYTEESMTLPISPYAFTKLTNESQARVLEKHGIPVTGLRFFTVYGEMGRPDMAIGIFIDSILHGKEVRLYNNGENLRDFTYVGDVAWAIGRILKQGHDGYQIYNIGNQSPIRIIDLCNIIYRIFNESGLIGRKPNIRLLPGRKGDMEVTFADVTKFEKEYGTLPHTTIEEYLKNNIKIYDLNSNINL